MSYGDIGEIRRATQRNSDTRARNRTIARTSPPRSSVTQSRPNPWTLPPIVQRDTSQGDPLSMYADMGLDTSQFTPEMQAALMQGQEPPIDFSDPLQNRSIADESKGLFLGSAFFDVVEMPNQQLSAADLYTPGAAQRWSPYTQVNSGLNVMGTMNGQTYGSGFNYQGRNAPMSPAADLYMLYQRGSGQPGEDGEDSTRGYLQKLLFSAGLVDRDNPIPDNGWGDPFDEDYDDAWKLAVQKSMQTGIPVMVLLRDRAAYFEQNGLPGSGSGRGSGGGAGPKRPTAQIISEDDARALVDQVAQQQLGRNLSDDEEALAKGIVSAVRDQMLSETNRAIDQQMAGGGSVSRPTDPSVSTQEQLESRMAGESGAYDIAQAFANLIGLSGGGRA